MARADGEIIVDEYEQSYDATVDEAHGEFAQQLSAGLANVECAVGEALYDDS